MVFLCDSNMKLAQLAQNAWLAHAVLNSGGPRQQVSNRREVTFSHALVVMDQLLCFVSHYITFYVFHWTNSRV